MAKQRLHVDQADASDGIPALQDFALNGGAEGVGLGWQNQRI